MIYTCYEMIRDCRENKPEGWRYFITNYVPVIQKLLAHYGGAALEPVLLAVRKPAANLFQSAEPAPERWFLAELRQRVMEQIEIRHAEIEIDLETVAAALAPLTIVEKQAAWFETMRYEAAESGAMLRMAPSTVEKIREKASELIRGSVSAWRRDLLKENGAALGRAAASGLTGECPPAKAFLDMLDGRTTWRGREEMERHVAGCWHCVDHFCRMAEVIEMLRGIQPLTDSQAKPFLNIFGIAEAKRHWWAGR